MHAEPQQTDKLSKKRSIGRRSAKGALFSCEIDCVSSESQLFLSRVCPAAARADCAWISGSASQISGCIAQSLWSRRAGGSANPVPPCIDFRMRPECEGIPCRKKDYVCVSERHSAICLSSTAAPRTPMPARLAQTTPREIQREREREREMEGGLLPPQAPSKAKQRWREETLACVVSRQAFSAQQLLLLLKGKNL